MSRPTTSKTVLPACSDTRTCFAKTSTGECQILTSTFRKDGACPFRKEDKYEWKKIGGTWQWVETTRSTSICV